MKKKIFYLSILFCLFMFNGCSDDINPNQENIESNDLELRASYNNGYFDWTKDEIEIIDSKGITTIIPAPWTGTHSLGIPDDWKYDGTNNNLYSKENGWELVYSNLDVRSNKNKFFALYSKYTGKLRFFFYALEGQQVSSNVYLGLSITKPTSFFNFIDDFSSGNDEKKEFPLLKYSPLWTFGGSSVQVGYTSQNWYGLEVDCAYDPDIAKGSFTFKGGLWGADISEITGTGITTGSITGTITSMSPNSPTFNLNFDNSQSNTTNNTTNINKGSIAVLIGKTIDVNSSTSSFFKGLKDKLTSGAQKGAEGAMKSLISGGGTEAVKMLGSLVNSITGGGSSTTKSVVDLTLKATTKIQLTAQKSVPGWELGLFPVAGSISNDKPLYDKPLGIWNLTKTPEVVVDMYEYETLSGRFIKRHSNYTYSAQRPDIILNPETSKEFYIDNFGYELVTNGSLMNTYFEKDFYTAQAYIDNISLYRIPHIIPTINFNNESINETKALRPKFYMRVYFDLVSKSSTLKYSYSRYFKVNNKVGKTIIQRGGEPVDPY